MAKKTFEQVIAEALKEYPNTATMTLARLLYKEHPKLFTSLEACRSAIRYRRGNNGAKHRNAATDKTHFRKNGEAGFKFEIPQSIANPLKTFQMPQGKTLLLADIHFPYHDDEALACALNHGDSIEPDTIYMNGDCMDFFSISRWDKNPEERNLPRELQLCRQFLAHLRERFPKARIIYKIGNHEERWEKYLWAKCPELCGCEFLSFEKILDFSKWGIEIVQGKQKAKWGTHLTAIHGHEIFGGFSPVNFARTLQTKMGVCTIGAHRHQTSEHGQKNADGDFVRCWGVGCLCDMHPDYATINGWNHGLAEIELYKNDFRVKNRLIMNGEVY